MKFDPGILRNDKSQQELLKSLLQSGRRIIFKFVDNEDKAEFMDNIGKLTGTLGFIAGATAGATAGASIGGLSAGPAGAVVGGIIGGVVGGIAGYSLGAWLAHFLYDEFGDSVIFKELFSWFGFLPNRVSIIKA